MQSGIPYSIMLLINVNKIEIHRKFMFFKSMSKFPVNIHVVEPEVHRPLQKTRTKSISTGNIELSWWDWKVEKTRLPPTPSWRTQNHNERPCRSVRPKKQGQRSPWHHEAAVWPSWPQTYALEPGPRSQGPNEIKTKIRPTWPELSQKC